MVFAVMLKLVARLFGFCGHEWKWEPSDFLKVDKRTLRCQIGHCERCGKMKIRPVYVDGF